MRSGGSRFAVVLKLRWLPPSAPRSQGRLVLWRSLGQPVLQQWPELGRVGAARAPWAELQVPRGALTHTLSPPSAPSPSRTVSPVSPSSTRTRRRAHSPLSSFLRTARVAQTRAAPNTHAIHPTRSRPHAARAAAAPPSRRSPRARCPRTCSCGTAPARAASRACGTTWCAPTAPPTRCARAACATARSAAPTCRRTRPRCEGEVSVDGAARAGTRMIPLGVKRLLQEPCCSLLCLLLPPPPVGSLHDPNDSLVVYS